MLRRCSLVFAIVSVLGSSAMGCQSGYPEAQGTITVCAAVVEDLEVGVVDRYTIDGTFSGLTRAVPETSWPAPEAFDICVSMYGVADPIELIDDNGTHIWLAVDVLAGDRHLITPGVFADIEGGQLDLTTNRGWTFNDDLVLHAEDGELRLALRSSLRLDDVDIAVDVEDGGEDGLPYWGTCSTITAHQLAFQGTDGQAAVLSNGEVGTVGDAQGTQHVVANIQSFEYGENRGCDDAITNATLYSWAVIIDR